MKYILFDLDGTISDSSEGIYKCFQYALAELGKPVLTDAELRPFIGPPLSNTFEHSLGLTPEEARKGLSLFRERYGTKGKFENHMYKGVTELVYTLLQAGHLLGIATSKPEKYAREILEYFGLATYFPVIVGASMDDSFSNKKDIMELAIKQGKSRNPEIDHIYMIGDRSYDMHASKELGVTAIGVTYGFGTEKELLDSGADYICHTPQEVAPIIEK